MPYISRLKALRDDLLPLIPPAQLMMRNWAGTKKPSIHDCGTAGCLAGWAGAYPPFIKRGFKLSNKCSSRKYYPTYKGNDSPWSAVRSFFGIRHDEFDHIFGADQPNDLAHAAARITDVIAAHTDTKGRKVKL